MNVFCVVLTLNVLFKLKCTLYITSPTLLLSAVQRERKAL